ncbi:MAG: NifU family protein [Mycobacteriales bacterium]
MTSPDRSAVERALEEIRPHLHGEIELVAIVGDEVRVRLGGTCTDCTMRQVTLRTGVEHILRARVPGVGDVVAV